MAFTIDSTTGLQVSPPLAVAQGGTGTNNPPAFRAWNSSVTSIPTATATKIALQSENFDTANAFDSVTNYRFQPLVAGYYQLTGAVGIVSSVIGFAMFYKNGAVATQGQYSTGYAYVVSDLVYLNGSTDYVELFVNQTSGGTVNTVNASAATYFSGALVRAA